MAIHKPKLLGLSRLQHLPHGHKDQATGSMVLLLTMHCTASHTPVFFFPWSLIAVLFTPNPPSPQAASFEALICW